MHGAKAYRFHSARDRGPGGLVFFLRPMLGLCLAGPTIYVLLGLNGLRCAQDPTC
jgi:hypothetical protein